MNEDEWIALSIFLIFVAFVSGLLLGASFSWHKRNEPEPWHARLASAEGKPRHDGKERSMNLLAVVLTLVVVSGVIVVDHFKGPLFPDLLYSLNDGGAQITRMRTRRVQPSPFAESEKAQDTR